MNKYQRSVVDYYKSLESKLGYTFLTWDTKHFGYYPSKKKGIPERKAQELMIDQVAKRLQLKKSDLVLDAGCGRGTASCYLAKKYGSKIIGIDLVDFELAKAKKRAADLKLGNKVTFFLKDYSRTKFPDNYFDKIFTLETLVHSQDIDKTLREFFRILKPGGQLVLFEYSRSPDEDFSVNEKYMLQFINSASSMASFGKMYHKTLTKHLSKAGFKIISQEDISDFVAPSLERFYKYAKVVYPIIKLLKLHKYFINTTAAVEFYKMGQKGLIKYRVFTAKK